MNSVTSLKLPIKYITQKFAIHLNIAAKVNESKRRKNYETIIVAKGGFVDSAKTSGFEKKPFIDSAGYFS